MFLRRTATRLTQRSATLEHSLARSKLVLNVPTRRFQDLTESDWHDSEESPLEEIYEPRRELYNKHFDARNPVHKDEEEWTFLRSKKDSTPSKRTTQKEHIRKQLLKTGRRKSLEQLTQRSYEPGNRDYLPRLGGLSEISDFEEGWDGNRIFSKKGYLRDPEEAEPSFIRAEEQEAEEMFRSKEASELTEAEDNVEMFDGEDEDGAEEEGAGKLFHQILIKTGYHTKVTTGGRINSSSALVLIGNGNGVGGLGYGKGAAMSQAMDAAIRDAKKKLIAIDRVNGSVSYQSKEKYRKSYVYCWPLANGGGIRCGYRMKEVCTLFGLNNIRIKTYGRRNDHNIFKALLRCFQNSETPEMHAQRRGKKIWDINKIWRVNNRTRAY